MLKSNDYSKDVLGFNTKFSNYAKLGEQYSIRASEVDYFQFHVANRGYINYFNIA